MHRGRWGTLLIVVCALMAAAAPAPASADTAYTGVATSMWSSCGVTEDGTVNCWGSGALGELGAGSGPGTLSAVPVPVPGVSGVKSIAAGIYHVCGLKFNGTVICWGAASFGQTGSGVDAAAHSPAEVAGVSDAVTLAAGQYSTCAVLESGTVKCWGHIQGDGTATAVTGISDATAVAVGFDSACALLKNGTVKCWGSNAQGALGDPGATSGPVTAIGVSGARAVSAGPYSMCAVLADGSAKCWGYNGDGVLGLGSASDPVRTPTTVTNVSGVDSLAPDSSTSCALLESRTIKCWGDGAYGVLGNGSADPSLTAVTVSGISDATAIARNMYHRCARRATGAVMCWGRGTAGQLGQGTSESSNVPVAVTGAGAGPGYAILNTGGKMRELSTTRDLACGRGAAGVAPMVTVSGCGTWVGAGGHLYGPSPLRMGLAWPRHTTPWIPTGQWTSGDGSAGSPWQIKTAVTSGDLAVVQTETYATDSNYSTVDIEVTNVLGSAQTVSVATAADCLHTDPETGFPTGQGRAWRTSADFTPGAAGCIQTDKRGRSMTWTPLTAGSTFMIDTPANVANSLPGFANSCACEGVLDDAVGLSWTRTLAPGERAHFTYAFSMKDYADIPPETPNRTTPYPADGPHDGGGGGGGGGGDGNHPPDDWGSWHGKPVPWNIGAIAAQAAWDEGLTGKGQTVAIVDTGVDFEHPWLGEDNNAADNPKIASQACWSTEIQTDHALLPDPPWVEGTCHSAGSPVPAWLKVLSQLKGVATTDLRDLTSSEHLTGDRAGEPKRDPCQATSISIMSCAANRISIGIGKKFFEGTFVAGIAAGKASGRVAGVAPDARVTAVNVSSWRDQKRVVANPNDTADALAWIDRQRRSKHVAAVQLMLPQGLADFDPDHYSDVDYGDGFCSRRNSRLESAIKRLVKNGVPVVVPTGDNAQGHRLPWPACLQDVIAVGSVNQSLKPYERANWSQVTRVVAPGVNVESALMITKGLTRRTGTYAAAAHVTGAIALYRQRYPKANARQIKKALTDSGELVQDDLGRPLRLLRVDRLIKQEPTG